jgi:hypothetical protein
MWYGVGARYIIVFTFWTKLTLHIIAASLDQLRKLQQICGTKPALASGQGGESVLWGEVRPVQWNLTLTALLVEKRYPVLATVFLPGESLKLTPGERVKGMGNLKFLWFCSTNACSATPFPIRWPIRRR